MSRSITPVKMDSKPFLIKEFRTQMGKNGWHPLRSWQHLVFWFSWLKISLSFTCAKLLTNLQELQHFFLVLKFLSIEMSQKILYSLCVDYKSIPLAFNIIFWRLFCNIKPIKFQFSSYFLFSLKNNQWDLRLKK